ncbi:MAG: MFS transporter [Bifidobacterium pseudocatenulatum]
MTAPTIPASESVRQKQPAQQSNQPEQPRRKHDRLITRDMALVMLATICFMSSNMLANPIVAGYAESLGASGMLMGVVAGSMSFISLFCRPIAGNLSDRTSKRTLVAAGTVLYFAAGLLYYFAGSPIMLIMARVSTVSVSHAVRSAGHVDVASAADSPYGCRHGITAQ